MAKRMVTFLYWAAVAIGLVLAIAWFLWPLLGAPLLSTRDKQGTVVLHRKATVVAVTPRPVSEANPHPAPAVVLRLDGKEVEVRTDPPPPVGQQVEVDYRIGKSGIVYVERIGSADPRR